VIAGALYRDTPSIVHDEITAVRPGQRLRYAELTAQEKRDYLFDHGVRPTAYDNYPDEARPDVVIGLVQFGRSAITSIAGHLLGETLTRVGDELEPPKPKLFHTYGTTAKVRFTPAPDTPYSGLLAVEAPALVRFSYAGPVAGVGVVPGLGLKLLVDGDHPSENLVAMRKLDRQQPLWRYFSTRSHNSVFQHPFTNILPSPRFTNVVMRTVNARFETVVQAGTGLHQPLDNLARVRADGAPVPPELRLAPHRIIFRPTREAAAASDPTIDFRDDLARNIPPGTPIYDVLALTAVAEADANRDGRARLEALLDRAGRIGTLTTESEFVASKYGDYRLFFKHSDGFMRPPAP
jgi:hypothetical protein